MKTKVDKITRCRGKKLDGRWDWSVCVWFGKNLFADCIIKSTSDFGTEEDAMANMEQVIKTLKLTAE